MNQKLPVFFMRCFLLFCTVGARATDYPVKNTEEFSSALKLVKPGDMIIWEDGAYNDLKINFSPAKNGKENAMIVLRARTAGKVVLSGNAQIFISGKYLQVEGFLFEGKCTLGEKESAIKLGPENNNSPDAVHCRVTNCAVVNYTRTEASGIDNNYIALEGTFNEIDHCYFYGKTNKGPTVVVNYPINKKENKGTDELPSTYHRVHHNYFGYRTYSSNGGEQIRVGVSGASNTHGFNIIEYNYFEDERNEGEVISNKSCDNIYRFNTLVGNDGALVLRNGRDNFAYGNYINGQSGRNESGGLRVVNFNNTVFNNYLENGEGGGKAMKSPIVVMDGLVGAGINDYQPAHNAIVAYNTVVNAAGPAIAIGVGNVHKGKAFEAPQNVVLVGNAIINTTGVDDSPLIVVDAAAGYVTQGNYFTNGATSDKGFSLLTEKDITVKGSFCFVKTKVEPAVMNAINKRLAPHKIKLTEKEIMEFDPKWIVGKKDVGVTWMK
jgi:poly(beta-D-mannuronate) lyase